MNLETISFEQRYILIKNKLRESINDELDFEYEKNYNQISFNNENNTCLNFSIISIKKILAFLSSNIIYVLSYVVQLFNIVLEKLIKSSKNFVNLILDKERNRTLYKKIMSYLKFLLGITLYFLSQLKVLFYFILQKLYNSILKIIKLILNNDKDKESRKNIKNYFEISEGVMIVIIFYQISKTIDKIFLFNH